MMLKRFPIVLGAIIVGSVGIILASMLRYDRENARLVGELLTMASSETDRVFGRDDLDGLPEPVQRYLTHVLTEGQPYVRTVRLQQGGDFRLGDASTPWKSLSATQHFTVDPPGFVWDASVVILPLVPVRVVDMYKAGEGALRAKILSAILVADAAVCPELNAGELMRFLAEAVWFPTALLPGEGVVWEPLDQQSARATIEHQGTVVSLVFFFNSRNEVERVFSEARYRDVDGNLEPTPWTGRFDNYQERNGMLIPIDGEVAWNLPEGDLIYWRGHVVDIEYELD